MSPVSSRDGVLTDSKSRKNELIRSIARSSLRRKRTLADLYAVTASEAPVPPNVDLQLDNAALDPGLVSFLDLNDIEKGRYYQESTVPRRRKHAEPPSRHSKRLAISSRSHSPLPPTPAQSAKSRVPEPVVPSVHVDSTEEDESSRRTRHSNVNSTRKNAGAEARLDSPARTARQPSTNGEQDASVSTPTKARVSTRQHTPQPAPTSSTRHSPSRRTASTPKRATASALIDAELKEDDGDGASAPDRHDTPNNEPQKKASSIKPAGRAQKEAVVHASDGLAAQGEPGSSASSTVGPSAATPRTDRLSPATSPDEDSAPSKSNFSPGKSHRLPGGNDQTLHPDAESDRRLRSSRAPSYAEPDEDAPTIPDLQSSSPLGSVSKQAKHSPRFSGSPSPARNVPLTAGLESKSKHDAIPKVQSSNSGVDVDMTDTGSTSEPAIAGQRKESIKEEPSFSASSRRPFDTKSTTEETSRGPSTSKPNIQVDTTHLPLSSSAGQPPPSPPASVADAESPAEQVARRPPKSGSQPCSIVLSDKFRPVSPPAEDAAPQRKDYMRTMFMQTSYRDLKHLSLKDLLKKSSKSLMTSDFLTEVGEARDVRIVKRVWAMQSSLRWSLRTGKPSPEPIQRKTHQDYLIRDVKFLQVDFREERKFKIEIAKQLAEACAEFLAADSNERLLLRGRYKLPKLDSEDILPAESDEISSLFTLRPDEVHAVISEDSIKGRLLKNIALFGSSTSFAPTHADSTKKKNNINKYILGRSREAAQRLIAVPDEDIQDNTVAVAIPPKDSSCVLWAEESKPLRDRLVASHAYKHPTDVRMPDQAFYEARAASHWTEAEDEALKRAVAQYTGNWALIADITSPSSQFRSGPDRRNSWECYERFLGITEPPPEINRHPVHQQFHRRLDTAMKHVLAKHEAISAAFQAQHPGQPVPPIKKKLNTPSRTNPKTTPKRFLALLDAARKLARKRETTRQREAQQQGDSSHQAQRAAAIRRIQDAPSQVRSALSSPQHYSDLKAEREEAERKALQNRRAFEIQRRAAAQQTGQQNALGNNIPPHLRGSTSSATAGQLPQAAMNAMNGQMNGLTSDQARQQAQYAAAMQMSLANGVPTQMGMKGMPQANMQAGMQQRLHPNMASANQIQRLMQHPTQQNRSMGQPNFQSQLLQQQQNMNQYGQSSSMSNLNGIANSNMLASYNHLPSGSTDALSPSLAATLNGSSGSPQMNQQLMATGGTHTQNFDAVVPSQSHPRPLSSGHVTALAQISHQISKQNPHLTPDQVSLLASQRLKEQYNHQRITALNAAAGAANSGASMQSENRTSPYNQAALGLAPGSPSQSAAQAQAQYQMQMRAQVMAQGKMNGTPQQQGVASGSNGNFNPGRTPTPNQQGMRPPSRSSFGEAQAQQLQQQAQQQLQRPGSAQSMASASGVHAHSPRPMSAGLAGGQ